MTYLDGERRRSAAREDLWKAVISEVVHRVDKNTELEKDPSGICDLFFRLYDAEIAQLKLEDQFTAFQRLMIIYPIISEEDYNEAQH